MYSKRSGESYTEFQQRVLDPISASFCAAKWLNATIWLGHGATASCHLPPAHRIPIDEIEKDPSALHNTKFKMRIRQEMLQGKKPAECDYCWKVESMGPGFMSDRLFKSSGFAETDIARIATADPNLSLNPRTLEIAFDRNCQFACSYCNAGFSTRWGQEIKSHGAYRGLKSDGAGAYKHSGEWASPFGLEESPYQKAFWKWWPSLSQDLEQLRITGGEPLLSPQMWKLLDRIRDTRMREEFSLAVNSNLGAPTKLIERLCEQSLTLPNFELYTSCEATGTQAEYIRDGLNYELFQKNVEVVLDAANLKSLTFMLTASALALDSIVDFLEQIFHWKKNQRALPVYWTINILRFPSFQSPLVLPKSFRMEAAQRLDHFLSATEANKDVKDFEREGVRRLSEYLRQEFSPHEGASPLLTLQSDFRSFFSQYDVRRKKDFCATFPSLKDWYQGLPVSKLPAFEPLISGSPID